jgi:hypothetical protein
MSRIVACAAFALGGVALASSGARVAAAPGPAEGDATAPVIQTFDDAAAGAVRVTRLDELVWALTAPCDHGDDVEQRQCRQVRDAQRQTFLAGTLLVDGEPTALTLGPWELANRTAPLSLAACVSCDGVVVDGKRWFVVGKGPRPPGERRGPSVHDARRAFPDEAAAASWRAGIAKLRVQFLIKVTVGATWSEGGRDGVAVDVVGFRVYSPCQGEVVCASPLSDVVEPDVKACGKVVEQVVAPTTAVALPERLSPLEITETLRPLGDVASRCQAAYGVRGKANLKISFGADGRVRRVTQTGDFGGTPTGTCLEKAAAKLRFGASLQPATSVTYPILLR